MELHERILCEMIAHEVIPSLHLDTEKLVEMKCYQVIREIHSIVSDHTLNDAECFQKIEKIVSALDSLGIGGGGRHDF